jgi:hypothetical protein
VERVTWAYINETMKKMVMIKTTEQAEKIKYLEID